VSHFIVTFDTDYKKEVVDAIKAVPGVKLTGRAEANGTLRIQTITRSLDDESNAVHAVEDIHGVVDVRLLEK
jgi:nitrate reductase NapAB chaperone NapD